MSFPNKHPWLFALFVVPATVGAVLAAIKALAGKKEREKIVITGSEAETDVGLFGENLDSSPNWPDRSIWTWIGHNLDSGPQQYCYRRPNNVNGGQQLCTDDYLTLMAWYNADLAAEGSNVQAPPQPPPGEGHWEHRSKGWVWVHGPRKKPLFQVHLPQEKPFLQHLPPPNQRRTS